jgi:hypothetical protein
MKGIMKNRVTWIATWNLHDQDSTEIVCAEGTRQAAIDALIEHINDNYDNETLQRVIDDFGDTSNEASLEELYTTFTLTMIEF